MQEQAPQSPYGSFNTQPVEATLEHAQYTDSNTSERAILEARADIEAATNTRALEETVQQKMEFTPLSPQEIIRMIGNKVVFDLRKGYNENHINLYEDASGPYIFNPETAPQDKPAGQVYQFPSKEAAHRFENDTDVRAA